MNQLEKKVFDSAVNFTSVYKENIGKHKSIREAKCLAEQFPQLLWDIQVGDIFAGRYGKIFKKYIVAIIPCAIGPGIGKAVNNQCGYCFNADTYEEIKAVADEEQKKVLDNLYNYWKNECTTTKFAKLISNDSIMRQYEFQGEIIEKYEMSNLYTFNASHLKTKLELGRFVAPGRRTGIRLAGVFIDFEKLIKLGIPGIYNAVHQRMDDSVDNKEFYSASLIALNILIKTILHYKAQAEDLADKETNPELKKNYKVMAETLNHIAYEKPKTLRQGLQLIWIYALVSGVSEFGRMDEYLGDLYVSDLESGRLCKQEAEDLIFAMMCMMRDTVNESDGRIIIGGYGRKNPKNADQLAYAIIKCQERIHDILPVSTLRVYKGMDKELLDKALKALSTGSLYPTLYNDDAYVKGMSELINLPRNEAEKYTPLGCGEMTLIGSMIASPNGTLFATKALEHALYNGIEPAYGIQVAKQTGNPDTFDTFEKFVDAVKQHMDFAIQLGAYAYKMEKQIECQEVSLLYISLLLDDCIEKGRDVFDGGVRYCAVGVEGFGFTDLIDSLYVIKQEIYEKKSMNFEQLKAMLLNDYEGFEKERQRFLSMPKYGNDDDEVDLIARDIYQYISERGKYWAKEYGFDAVFVSNVNPGAYVCGKVSGATPNGRRNGDFCTVGNSPGNGQDRNGLIAMLNSISKINSANGGYITNLKVSKEMFTKHEETFRAILDNFFANGGQQLNITCVDKADMERALIEPERYQNLIVRLGGWAARFVELDRKTQQEVMRRTHY